ncbi:MAG: polysaccharide biosynthesis protein [Thermodesulfobacteriota bacterium]
MWRDFRNPNFYFMIAVDAMIFALSLISAYLVRFEFAISEVDLNQIKMLLPYLITCKLFIFYYFGLYRGMWRYTSMSDLWHLVQASLVNILITVAIVFLLFGTHIFSRAVILLDGTFAFLLTGAYRVGIRYFYSLGGSERNTAWSWLWQKEASHIQRRTLIIGAGDAGEKLLREIWSNPQIHYHVVGFLDDDPKKQRRSVHGVEVLGSVDNLCRIVEEQNILEVLVAIPSASGAEMRRIMQICQKCGVHYKTIPGIGEIIAGRVSIKALRDVNYEDLLRREPVRLDDSDIRAFLSDRVVLVTGGGGSIGSELCRQVVSFNPRCLIMLDASEANLFNIQMRLRHEFQYHNCYTILGWVQDRLLMEEVFRKYHPEVVLHAAAYKHVPMLEIQPWKAVHNNILGSQVAMEMAVQYGTTHFVLVSTDKAVRPINVMGASKRASEILLQSFKGNGTKFVAVRFGNVVGSSGSVIPLFRRQIEAGGPITVTHPEVTRFFMTIPEASQLILQSVCLGKDGGIFVLKMGSPVKIVDMAKDLIQLSGKEPGRDIPIIFTGLREGEKLYEELLIEGEDILSTKHEKIMWLSSNNCWNGFSTQEEFKAWLNRELNELYQISNQFNAPSIKQKLKKIVPEYTPQESDCVL